MLSQGLANIFLQVVIYKEGLPTSRKKRPFFSFVWLLLPSSSSSIHIIRHNNAGNVIMTSKQATKEGPHVPCRSPSGYSRGF